MHNIHMDACVQLHTCVNGLILSSYSLRYLDSTPMLEAPPGLSLAAPPPSSSGPAPPALLTAPGPAPASRRASSTARSLPKKSEEARPPAPDWRYLSI